MKMEYCGKGTFRILNGWQRLWILNATNYRTFWRELRSWDTQFSVAYPSEKEKDALIKGVVNRLKQEIQEKMQEETVEKIKEEIEEQLFETGFYRYLIEQMGGQIGENTVIIPHSVISEEDGNVKRDKYANSIQIGLAFFYLLRKAKDIYYYPDDFPIILHEYTIHEGVSGAFDIEVVYSGKTGRFIRTHHITMYGYLHSTPEEAMLFVLGDTKRFIRTAYNYIKQELEKVIGEPVSVLEDLNE